MKWITRERARVDRIACPWLISRFIDPKPEFLFVPANQVLDVAKREQRDPVRHPERRARASRPAVLLRRLRRAVRAGGSGARRARPHRPGRRYRRPGPDAGVGRAVCRGDRIPGDQPGRLRQHGAPVPAVRRLYAYCRGAGRGAGAAPGAVRLSARGGQERHRGGALPPSRSRPGSRDGRGGGGHRAGRGAGARGGEGARRRRACAPRRAVRGPSRSTTWPARPASSASAATSRRRRASGSTSGRCPPSATGMRPRGTASWRTWSAWSRSSRRDADVPLRHRGFIELPAHAKPAASTMPRSTSPRAGSTWPTPRTTPWTSSILRRRSTSAPSGT